MEGTAARRRAAMNRAGCLVRRGMQCAALGVVAQVSRASLTEHAPDQTQLSESTAAESPVAEGGAGGDGVNSASRLAVAAG
jgi:hypothetical protein